MVLQSTIMNTYIYRIGSFTHSIICGWHRVKSKKMNFLETKKAKQSETSLINRTEGTFVFLDLFLHCSSKLAAVP